MADAARALLDSLMGGDRDAGNTGKKLSWKDDKNCKHFFVWDCPHSLFVNQSGEQYAKSPLGVCKKEHSEAMKERFLADPEKDKFRPKYLRIVQNILQKLMDETDAQKVRYQKFIDDGMSASKEVAFEVKEGAQARQELVDDKVAAAERMAAEGDMEMSQKIMEEANKLAKQKEKLEKKKEKMDDWVDEVCDICGRMINYREPEEIEARKRNRPHPHTSGSWHQGFLRARESLKLLDEELVKLKVEGVAIEEEKQKRSKSRKKRSTSRPKQEEKGVNKKDTEDRDRGKRDKSRGREGGRGRDKDDGRSRRHGDRRGDRSRSRSRDRGRGGQRHRSRSRGDRRGRR